MNALNFVIENAETLIAIIGAIVTVFSLIASLTPNPTDDGIAKKLNKVVDMLALNFGSAKKER